MQARLCAGYHDTVSMQIGASVPTTYLTDELTHAESLLVAGEDDEALRVLSHLAEDVEQYASANCPSSESEQWFSFPTIFERLCYRRVEDDPRELHDVGEPFDRVYADLATAYLRADDVDAAIEALKQACRWNPMNCGYRLDLAELFRSVGNANEYLALTYSVFERASDVRHLARAYLNFAGWFAEQGKPRVAAAALRAARNLDVRDERLDAQLGLAAGTERDPDSVSDDEAEQLLGAEGIEYGANAEVAICLLMCAADAAAAGDEYTATRLTLRARDLVGERNAMALLALIREGGGDADGQGDEAGA